MCFRYLNLGRSQYLAVVWSGWRFFAERRRKRYSPEMALFSAHQQQELPHSRSVIERLVFLRGLFNSPIANYGPALLDALKGAQVIFEFDGPKSGLCSAHFIES
jgi:hypothetical protein